MPIATNPSTGDTVFLDSDGAWKPAQTAVNPQTREMLAFDGQNWSPVPAQSKGILGYIDDAVRSLASGATFGYADKLAAAANSMLGSGTYEQNLAQERARTAAVPAALSIPGEVAGAVGSTLAAAPVLGPLAAATGATRLPGLVKAIGSGAGAGALFGSGTAEPGQALEGAAKGAAIGGVTGAAAYPVVRGIGALAGKVADAISPQANVAADLGRALTRDEMTPQQLTQRAADLQAIRPGVATLADVGGENVRGLVERVAQTPGAGRTQVVPALTERQQGQLGRLSDDLKSLTGTQKTAMQAIDDTMAERAQAATPAYDAAMNFNARQAPEIVNAWTNETRSGYGKQILNSAEFKNTLQTEYGIENAADAPLMVQIDAFAKQARDMAGAASRQGYNNQARVIGNMRDRLLNVVDQANPAYQDARSIWAGKSQYLDAVNEGRSILDKNMSAEELGATLANMGNAEQEGYRIGAVSSIINKMGNDPAKLADMTKYLRSPEMRAKVAAMMPTPEAAAQWGQRLNFEVGSSEMTGRALGNSATARRLAEQQDAKSLAGDLVMGALAGHGAPSLLRTVALAGPAWLRDTLRSKSDAALWNALTNPAQINNLQSVLDRLNAAPRLPGALPVAATAAGAQPIFNR